MTSELSINFDDVPDIKVLPEGAYLLELTGADLKQSKTSENEYINWQFTVVEESEFKGATLYSTNMVAIYDDAGNIDEIKTTNSHKYLKKFLTQLGYKWSKRGFNPAEDPKKMANEHLKIIGNVIVTEYQGNETNSIQSFAPVNA